jgi:hypothetical protein
MAVDVEVRGGAQLHRVARQVREAARTDLRRELLQAFRKAGKSLVDDEKSTVAALPVHGFPVPGRRRRYTGPSTPKNLRANVAAATTLEVRLTGDDPAVRVKVANARMPASQKRMHLKLNKDSGWRHPVLGNRHAWAKQQGENWFEPTGQRHVEDFTRESVQALDRVAAKIG